MWCGETHYGRNSRKLVVGTNQNEVYLLSNFQLQTEACYQSSQQSHYSFPSVLRPLSYSRTMAHQSSPDGYVESLAGDAVKPFGSDIMIDRVVMAVEESHRVRGVAAVVSDAEAITSTRGYSEQTVEKASHAFEQMGEEIENVVDEVVAVACAEVISEASPDLWENSDVIMEEMVHEAVKEAKAWLSDHPDAANRAGVEVEPTPA